MTAGAHESGGGFGKSAGVNAARGLGVVLFAVVVGVLLMVKGIDKPDSVAASVTTTTTTPESDEAPIELTPEADVEEPVVEAPVEVVTPTVARPPAEVTAFVINGSGLNGVAGRGTTKLTEAGYLTLTPGNANAPAASAIFYTEGFELEAQAIAAVFGIPIETTVFPLDPANSPIDDILGANILVRVGNDGVIQV